ncbi:M24 family metallopeptidase [Limobrevibacterium gyesilva]|uniref:Xaa-Pro peptidase family protein n=1 Tax=Limobrevibacterium gyesilva TaxID=2991712 RepID=A0AA41YM97_9PROT|nr:Xaa-Pro peptidase family protein [Limobrevibacterium gyesilva]MCW3473078.1 Xaa-Pro peptidase family protein [Limobrevibacterium gyesilva]
MTVVTPGEHIHFSRDEFAARRARTLAEMQRRGLSTLLMFRQESMYWLTGYDTFGYVYFQCLVLTDDGRMVLLTRAPDRLQARFTSIVEDIRIWVDGPDASPAQDLRDILRELGRAGTTLGVEWEAYGLTARNGQRLSAALDGFATLDDASDLISRLRVVKSAAELEYVRRAAALADDALDAAELATAPGAFEGDILADMQSAVFTGGGDDPANEYIIGSGPGALMCRYFTGRRHLDADDQLTLEFAGAYRHYHACLMRTFLVGHADPRLIDMHAACTDALLAAEAALRPGDPVGAAFDAHARTLDARGLREHRLNACGYSLGTTYAPNWMDWPMLYAGQALEAQPGMVFFIHIIVFDATNGLAMTLGRTSLVTERGSESLSRGSIELVQK